MPFNLRGLPLCCLDAEPHAEGVSDEPSSNDNLFPHVVTTRRVVVVTALLQRNDTTVGAL